MIGIMVTLVLLGYYINRCLGSPGAVKACRL
jgi:hypothetical protein